MKRSAKYIAASCIGAYICNRHLRKTCQRMALSYRHLEPDNTSKTEWRNVAASSMSMEANANYKGLEGT